MSSDIGNKLNGISNDLKDQADKTQQKLQNLFNQNKQLSNAEIVQHLRLGQVIANFLLAFVLLSASDRLGLLSILPPFILNALNIFLTGKRWYHQVDGRYDVQTMVNSRDFGEKAKHGLVVFAGLLLALLVHFMSPKTSSGFVMSGLFSLADFLAILLGGICTGYEVFEGLKIEKNRRRSSVNPAAWYGSK
uniref:DUF4395 domain-containing protein n=1 Tax=Acrobeloides nanus TaxID=290746 RepID=A0A914CF26_9BILA